MNQSDIFGYSIKQQDNNLVITVSGEFAGKAIEHLRSAVSSGHALSILSRLSPLGPLSRLMSAHVDMVDASKPPAPNGKLDLEAIFNQGFDNTYSGFQRELNDVHQALSALELRPEGVQPEPVEKSDKKRK